MVRIYYLPPGDELSVLTAGVISELQRQAALDRLDCAALQLVFGGRWF